MQGTSRRALQECLQHMRLMSNNFATTSRIADSAATEGSTAARAIDALRQRLATGLHSVRLRSLLDPNALFQNLCLEFEQLISPDNLRL